MPERPKHGKGNEAQLRAEYERFRTKKPKVPLIARLKDAMEQFGKKKHSHEREDARRRRQIARGIIQVTA